MIHVACFALTMLAMTPPYTYDGLMIRPTKEWVMFEPHTEFIVGDHLCRAMEQPRCTWWNAMFLESMNTSLRQTNATDETVETVRDRLYIGVPWMPRRRHAEIISDIDEVPCMRRCLVTNCSAVTWFSLKQICAMTHDDVDIDASEETITSIARQKLPTRKSYVVKGHGIRHDDVRRFIQHLIDLLGCRLNKFRCAA